MRKHLRNITAVSTLIALLAVILSVIPAYAQDHTYTTSIIGNPTSINAGTTYSILDTITNTSGVQKLYTISHELDYPISPGWPTGWFLTEGASTFGGSATGGSCVDGGIPNPSSRNCSFWLNNGATGTVTTPFKPGTCMEHPVVGYWSEVWNNGQRFEDFGTTYLSGSGLATVCNPYQVNPLNDTKSRNTTYTIATDVTMTRSPTYFGTIRFNDATSTITAVSGKPGETCTVVNTHRAECTYPTMGDSYVLSMTVTYKTANSAYNVWRNFIIFNSSGKYQTHEEGLLQVP